MKNLIVIFFTMFVATTMVAQNISINADGTAPDGSAMLDVVSTSKGLLIPRMTEAQRTSISNPATSLVVYQTNNDAGFYFNAGTPGTPSWIKLITNNDLGDPVALVDSDSDTRIDVEGTGDDDIISFELAGTEYLKIDTVNNTGNVPTARIQFLNNGDNIIMGGNAGNSISNTGGNGVRNIIIGNNSGNGDTDYSNVFLGYNVASANGTAQNVAIGNEAARLGLNRSVAIGHGAGAAGGLDFSVAIGYEAAPSVSSSSFGTIVGNSSGTSLTTGNYNTLIGNHSGNSLVTGGRNTLLGSFSGYNTLGESNIFVGDSSGYFETGSDKLYIENSASASPLIYGDFANDSVSINGFLAAQTGLQVTDGNVGFGTNNPTTKLDIQSINTDADAIIRTGNSDLSHFVSIFPGRLNDPNPFIQWKQGDPMRFVTDEGGFKELARITSDGKFGLNNSSPDSLLDVAGGAQIDRLSINGNYSFPTDVPSNGEVLKYDGTDLIWDTDASSSSPWTATGSEINYTAGKVGIGTSSVLSNVFFEVDNSSQIIGAYVNHEYAGGASNTALVVNSDGASNQAKTGISSVLRGTTGSNQGLTGIQSTVIPTDGSAYAFKGSFTGSGTGTRWGIAISGEEKSSLSGALSVAGGTFFSGYDLTVGGKAVLGKAGTDGELRFYSEQGTTDYNLDLKPNPAMTANVDFVFPPAAGSSGDVLTLDASGNTLWQSVTATDADWTVASGTVYNNTNQFAVGTTSIPAAYLGEFEVASGGSQTVGLSIDNNYNGAAQTWGVITDISNAGTGEKYGVYNTIISNAAQSNPIFGIYNDMKPALNELSVGTANNFSSSGNGSKIGVRNTIQSPNGTASEIIGVDNSIINQGSSVTYGTRSTINTLGTGIKYGDFIDLSVQTSSASDAYGSRKRMNVDGSGTAYGVYLDYTQATGTGTHYGIYSDGEDDNYFSGNVGIGTSAPSNLLSVANTTSAAYFDVKGTGDSFNFSGFKLASDETTDKSWSFYHRKNATELNNFAIEFDNGSGGFNKPFNITASGNIGIGDNNILPTSSLDVDGNLEIDGGSGSVGDDAFYFGDPSTDGTWRIKRDGSDLSFERRESGAWVFKMKINP